MDKPPLIPCYLSIFLQKNKQLYKMKIYSTLLIIFFTFSIYAQVPLEYRFDIPLLSKNKKKNQEKTKEWLSSQNIQIFEENKDSILASGTFEFLNTIVFEKSKTYSRVYREQTDGVIEFNIKVYFSESNIEVLISEFKHQPEMRFDNLNFGLITTQTNAPKQVSIMTSINYSTEVWNLLKKSIVDFTDGIIGGFNDTALR